MAYQTTNPYNNQVIKTYQNISDADLAQALTATHQQYQDWRSQPVSDRAVILHRIAKLMRTEKTSLAKVVTQEMGKLIGESEDEVELCANIADYFADHAADFLKPTPLKTGIGEAYYQKQALGVLFMVEPWNFPYYQIMRVFAPNFMIGNPLLLKHASNTPGSAAAFVEVIRRAGAPVASLINLFVDYDQVAKAIADPRVVGVALTGSERGGASVAQTAGANLKKSTMELGGNDPFIILDDADMTKVAAWAPAARLANAGQICAASKRFIVMADKYEDFLKLLKTAFAAVKPGDPMDRATTLAPLSSARSKATLQKQVDAAIAGGAKVYYGNEKIDLSGQFFQPTILTDIDQNNPVYNQELFGPVASVYKVHSEAEAIQLANDSSYGLGSAIFSEDTKHAQAVASQIEAGMTFINRAWATLPELPFGGVKNSGYGREMYELGFDAFVNEHLVVNAK
ncbi:NAD-dependent succinate-semialdehyde dehydrogenase [Lactiplantibacillus sp. WILCCON 0030]|uniref:NAD-dependent succinate-semialdehyde dehydrogenase n=1 Tax=Lactiplantibacillus brownii TaxID=3069269 RepID=A0ABU1AAE6_9LACO|nr:NAD-dependent succinate-semialdehyde dehydrogenase [Lactiplantibacillus brownii]MDQ7937967.1 NAD-dependent succinate-semialdehyde dehydrogenase [Lactiplantibacillus brownii]